MWNCAWIWKESFQENLKIDPYKTTEFSGIPGSRVPSSEVEVKYIDDPDAGYTITEKKQPRGEIIIRFKIMVSKYWFIQTLQNNAQKKNFDMINIKLEY